MVQEIGLDIGRGYVKAYSDYNGREIECLFKAVYGEGRDLENITSYKDSIYVECEGNSYFVGILAEKESQMPIRNSKDSKVTATAQILLATALNEVAVCDKVKIVLGVPYKSFNKFNRTEIKETYEGKVVVIKDKINGGTKKITIESIDLFRESDAALYSVLENKVNSKPTAMITVGFRTTELAYFDKGLAFNDKKSRTIEFGNRTVLKTVQDALEKNGINKELNEIDTSKEYKKLKQAAYLMAGERVDQIIEDEWVNLNEMNIYIAGGTSLYMKFDEQFKVIDNPQMATAKGLYLIATKIK